MSLIFLHSNVLFLFFVLSYPILSHTYFLFSSAPRPGPKAVNNNQSLEACKSRRCFNDAIMQSNNKISLEAFNITRFKYSRRIFSFLYQKEIMYTSVCKKNGRLPHVVKRRNFCNALNKKSKSGFR